MALTKVINDAGRKLNVLKAVSYTHLYGFAYGETEREAVFPAKGYRLVSVYGNGRAACEKGEAKIFIGGKPLAAAVALLEKIKRGKA